MTTKTATGRALLKLSAARPTADRLQTAVQMSKVRYQAVSCRTMATNACCRPSAVFDDGRLSRLPVTYSQRPKQPQNAGMPDQARSAALTVELVKAFARELASIDRAWQRAFLRLAAQPGVTEVKASLVGSRGVEIVDVVAHKPFFHWANGIVGQLRDSLPSTSPFKVALVELNADFSYEVKYEFDNAQRWAISKLNGGSGLPTEY
ncbi:MAG TPA: hypothetical protein VF453_22195 [Burkholderiaceae bacterium]